jgi:hypothetical protein
MLGDLDDVGKTTSETEQAMMTCLGDDDDDDEFMAVHFASQRVPSNCVQELFSRREI